MTSSTSAIIFAHVKHHVEDFIIYVILGSVLPAFLIVMGGGELFYSKLQAPLLFGTEEIATKVMYGIMSYLFVTVITKGWLVEGCIDHWSASLRLHRMNIDRMKFGPAYFRRQA